MTYELRTNSSYFLYLSCPRVELAFPTSFVRCVLPLSASSRPHTCTGTRHTKRLGNVLCIRHCWIAGTLRLIPSRHLPTLGCSRFPIVVDSIHPRCCINKAFFFPSGVFGTPHYSDRSLSGRLLDSCLRPVALNWPTRRDFHPGYGFF